MEATDYELELKRDISTLLGKRVRSRTLLQCALMNGREVLRRQREYEDHDVQRRYGQAVVQAAQSVHWWISTTIGRTTWRKKTFAQLCDPLWGAGLACELLNLSHRHNDVKRYLQLSLLLHSDLHVFDYYVALRLSGEDDRDSKIPTHVEETDAYMQLSEAAF
jgi:hypothetical protein